MCYGHGNSGIVDMSFGFIMSSEEGVNQQSGVVGGWVWEMLIFHRFDKHDGANAWSPLTLCTRHCWFYICGFLRILEQLKGAMGSPRRIQECWHLQGILEAPQGKAREHMTTRDVLWSCFLEFMMFRWFYNVLCTGDSQKHYVYNVFRSGTKQNITFNLFSEPGANKSIGLIACPVPG